MSSQSGSFTDRSSSSINSSSATAVAQENTGRQYLFIQNLSAVVMYVRFGTTDAAIAAAGTIYLAANGGSMEFQGETFCPSSKITVISASSSSLPVTVLEG